jgi:hypothetical protein
MVMMVGYAVRRNYLWDPAARTLAASVEVNLKLGVIMK